MRRLTQIEIKIKTTIEDFLKKDDNYSETDDMLIEELLFNWLTMQAAKKDIKKRGIILNKDREVDENGNQRGDDKKNKSFEIYLQCNKELKDIFVKLSITPQERSKLKIEITKKIDEFEEAFK